AGTRAGPFWLGNWFCGSPAALIGGLAVGLAFTMRLTSLVFALPLALGILMSGEGRVRLAGAAALGLGAFVVAVLVYDEVVFGSPLTTGYHYWLSESDYRLSLDLELVQRN